MSVSLLHVCLCLCVSFGRHMAYVTFFSQRGRDLWMFASRLASFLHYSTVTTLSWSKRKSNGDTLRYGVCMTGILRSLSSSSYTHHTLRMSDSQTSVLLTFGSIYIQRFPNVRLAHASSPGRKADCSETGFMYEAMDFSQSADCFVWLLSRTGTITKSKKSCTKVLG